MSKVKCKLWALCKAGARLLDIDTESIIETITIRYVHTSVSRAFLHTTWQTLGKPY